MQKWRAYLAATGRKELAAVADKNKDILRADDDVVANPKKYFDEVYEIDFQL
jgi:aconitate hydratase